MTKINEILSSITALTAHQLASKINMDISFRFECYYLWILLLGCVFCACSCPASYLWASASNLNIYKEDYYFEWSCVLYYLAAALSFRNAKVAKPGNIPFPFSLTKISFVFPLFSFLLASKYFPPSPSPFLYLFLIIITQTTSDP
jgi:hypothetical protein